ncbi:hypothetical protein CEXT_157581 [Caerostris extrusa]|uniref:Uncharacterized protein n=1 Tax=Caerostris extrusa TaxID=172846 RepID=A0AAV4XL61_CAEEX|nr:hypothetical protein CEXT_157581 [Caerostris extrusa]
MFTKYSHQPQWQKPLFASWNSVALVEEETHLPTNLVPDVCDLSQIALKYIPGDMDRLSSGSSLLHVI